jgi:putative serine protease PepD
MNEPETNPQRPETPYAEPSHQPADASFESSSPERGQSEPTAAQPTVQQPAVHEPTGHQPPAHQPAVHQPVGQQPSAPPASPWQSPQHQPQPQSPFYGQPPQHPGYPHQQQYPAYGQQQPPYSGVYGPERADQPAGPAWAAPVATQTRQPGSGRGRKIFVAGAAAVLIALAGGGVGAATVLALDDNNGVTAVQTGNASTTRVVDRSSLAQIAAAVQDSVVSITTGTGEGSGVIISADGYMLTNNHVVATAQGKTVNVIFADGKKTTATIVGTDPRTDLAVIKATGVSGLKAAKLGDSSQMEVGDTVLALGSPLGLEGSVTAGIISAKDRTIQTGGEDQQDPQNPFGQQQQPQQQQSTTSLSGLLQTDAPINPGNSGGALVNTSGEVIGINSAIATSGSTGNIGLGFAIPSNKARTVADALMAGKKVSHAALGVNVTPAENGGALVANVVANGAAAKAGLEQGDVITTVNGKTINDADDLIAVIQGSNVGDQATIVFTRNGAQKTVTATLAEAG